MFGYGYNYNNGYLQNTVKLDAGIRQMGTVGD